MSAFLAGALLIACAAAPPASAQARVGPVAGDPTCSATPVVPRVCPATAADGPGAGTALRSLVVPGWGQLVMDQRRGWAYLAAEGMAVALHLRWKSRGHDLRDAYRDLAWSAARTAGTRRVDPDFTYYERLGAWTRSGAWDAAPGVAGLQPESDPATFNGSVWRRAADLYLQGDAGARPSDSGYGAALAYYEERAYAPDFLWDWTGKEADLDRYRDLIDDSDGHLRRATHAVGALLANHVLSAVDAWVSSRAGLTVRSGVLPHPDGAGAPGWAWSVAVSR